jgi:hypothetical protein
MKKFQILFFISFVNLPNLIQANNVFPDGTVKELYERCKIYRNIENLEPDENGKIELELDEMEAIEISACQGALKAAVSSYAVYQSSFHALLENDYEDFEIISTCGKREIEQLRKVPASELAIWILDIIDKDVKDDPKIWNNDFMWYLILTLFPDTCRVI